MPALPLPRQQRQQGPGAQSSGWRLPARLRPTPAEGRLLGGGPQCADGDDDEAGELPARRRPTPAEGRLLGGGPQCADGDDDEAGELPARRRREPLFGTIFPRAAYALGRVAV